MYLIEVCMWRVAAARTVADDYIIIHKGTDMYKYETYRYKQRL